MATISICSMTKCPNKSILRVALTGLSVTPTLVTSSPAYGLAKLTSSLARVLLEDHPPQNAALKHDPHTGCLGGRLMTPLGV